MNDPTPAMKRAAAWLYPSFDPPEERPLEIARGVLDAALDVDDDDAVEAMARAIWPELYDGTTEQSLSDAGLTTLAANRRAAFLRQDLMQYARAGYRAIRTSILGGDS